jgi:hypothetical protein
MSENTTNKNVKDDEIDLLDLFRRMGKTFSRWLHGLGRAFLISIVFLLKRWLPLGISIAFGIGTTYFIMMTSDSFYTSDIVLRNNIVSKTMSNSEMISYINQLHTYSSEGNLSMIAKVLSISEQQASNIIDISAFWIIDQKKDKIPDYVDYKENHNIYDTTNIRMQDRFDIRVKTKIPQELSLVKNGIIAFIESDSLNQQINRLRLRQNYELLTRLNYDIVQLDSLQKVKYREENKSIKPLSGGQMIFLQEQKTQLVYTDIYKLYSQKQALESDRDLYKGIVTVLSEFSLPAKRDNGGLYYGKNIIPLFFLFMLLILILLANRKKLEEVYNKY